MSSTLRKAASGPDATADSLPALMTLALPETGQATNSAPSAVSCSRMSAESSTEMVEQSTTIFGILPLPFGATPFGPNSTSFTSLPADTMREQHIDAGQVGQLVDHLAADLGQRLGLGLGPVPDRDVVAGLQQPFGHCVAHAAHADPADGLLSGRHFRSSRAFVACLCDRAVVAFLVTHAAFAASTSQLSREDL